MRVDLEFEHIKTDFSNQGIPIAVQSVGCNADNLMSHTDFRAVHNLVVVDDSHRKAGHIILIILIKTRHFGRFSADQGTFGLLAPAADALNDIFNGIAINLPGGKIV